MDLFKQVEMPVALRVAAGEGDTVFGVGSVIVGADWIAAAFLLGSMTFGVGALVVSPHF